MKYLLWIILPLWLVAAPAYSQYSGSEVVVDPDLSITIPVVAVGEARYSAVLTQVPAGMTAMWKVAAITPLTGSARDFISATFAENALDIPCVLHRDKQYSAVLKSTVTQSNRTFTLDSLKPNPGCSIPSGPQPANPLSHQGICDGEVFDYAVNGIGLPLLQSRPQAKVSIYLDYSGGTFINTPVGIFDQDNDPSYISSYEQDDIVCGWKRITEYFAMFDLNVSTDASVKETSSAFAWILIGGPYQMDFGTGNGPSGGVAYINVLGAKNFVHGWISAQNGAAYEDGSVLAHEIGHVLGLQHQGSYVNGNFVAEGTSFTSGDTVNGAIMGAGYQPFNYWRLGYHKGPGGDKDFQDDIEIMRTNISKWSNSDGWHPDDLDDQRTTSTYVLTGSKQGVIEKPGDKDTVAIVFKGGSLSISAKSRSVSTADLVLTVYDSSNNVLAGPYNSTRVGREVITVPDLPAGIYYAEVSSTAVASPYSNDRLNVLGAYNIEVIKRDFKRLSDLIFPDANLASCVAEIIRNQGYVMVEELTDMYCSGKDIRSAVGIEQLTALEILYLSDNNLSELDVSNNVRLQALFVENNALQNIDVTNNHHLTGLYISNNMLSGINLRENLALEDLRATDNLLQDVDLSKNVSLRSLNLSGNQLFNLDITKNSWLIMLNLSDNKLQQLSFFGMSNLQSLELQNNQLTVLDLRDNHRLSEANFAGNEVRELILSSRAPVQRLDVSDNRLSQSTIQLLQNRNIATLITGTQR